MRAALLIVLLGGSFHFLYGIVLDPNGVSTLAWAFRDLSGWTGLRTDGHGGDDYWALDWNRGSHNDDLNAELFSVMSGQVIYVATGQPILSTAPPTNYGNQVVILNDEFVVRYAHLQNVSVSLGTSVSVGDSIGTVGCSGLTCRDPYYAHLHLAVYKNIKAGSAELANLRAGAAPTKNYSGPATEYSARYQLDPSGASIISKRLIKSDNSPSVYWHQGTKRFGIPTMDVITTAMSGMPGWNADSILTISSNMVNAIPEGPVFIKTSNVLDRNQSDGLLIRLAGTSPVYMVENGTRRWIRSLEALDWINGVSNFPNVIDVTLAIISGYVPNQGNDIYAVGEGESDEPAKDLYITAYRRNAADNYCKSSPDWKGWPGSFSECLRFPIGPVRTAYESSVSQHTGKFQEFGNDSTVYGSIQYDNNTGSAFVVWGAIYRKWQELGFGQSRLGFPVSDEYQWDLDRRRTDFEGGYIYWTRSTDQTTVVYGQVLGARTPILTLDKGFYCTGDRWILNVSNGARDSSIFLTASKNGIRQYTDFAIGSTNLDGNLSPALTGTFTPGLEGSWVETAKVAGQTSPPVSFAVFDCPKRLPTTPILTLDKAIYSVGDSWKLTLSNGAPNKPVVLTSWKDGSQFPPYQIGVTDNFGNLSPPLTGVLAPGTEGNWTHIADVDGQKSLPVSFTAVSTSDFDWTQKFPFNNPGFRGLACMAYDEAHGQTVLFGGQAADLSEPNDTWLWDGSNWIQKLPAGSPIGRIGCSMVYDKARGQIVMFGGWNFPGDVLKDTWVWDGNNWIQKSPVTNPPARTFAAMTYDVARRLSVLFGGASIHSPLLKDTWVWDGNNWTQRLPVNSPTARSRAAMTFDPLRNQAVLFGGVVDENCGNSVGCQYVDETWVWDGVAWSQKTPLTHPSVRYHTAMAWDDIRGQVLLFGGVYPGIAYNDSWQWNGTTWAQVFPRTKPGPVYGLHGHVMTYDAIRERVVLYGGNCCGPGNETWVWGPRSTVPTISSYNWDRTPAAGQNFSGTVTGAGFVVSGTRVFFCVAGTNNCFEHPPEGVNVGNPNSLTLTNVNLATSGSYEFYVQTTAGPSTRSIPFTVFPIPAISMLINKTAFCVGDTWNLRFSDPSSADKTVYLNLWLDQNKDSDFNDLGEYLGSFPDGAVMSDGTWELSGRHESSAIGSWQLQAIVGNQISNAIVFTVSACSLNPQLASIPARASSGTFTVSGTNFTTSSTAVLHIRLPNGNEAAPRSKTTNVRGGFTDTYTIQVGDAVGVYTLWAIDNSTGVRSNDVTQEIVSPTSDFDWTQKFPANSPILPSYIASDRAAIAYDAARGQVVLFGFGNTWVWDGTNWTLKSPANSPTLFYYLTATYDAARRQVVLFGGRGIDVNQRLNDTWVWDGTNWTQKFPATSPPPMFLPAMAYDAARGQVVLFGLGGPVNEPVLNTWVWDGTNWTQKFPATSPSLRQYGGMAYDAARRQVVLFGGIPYNGVGNDTWVWDGTNWTQKFPATSPPPDAKPAMVYDSARGHVVLFGGGPGGGTWVWDGNNWTQEFPANSPTGRQDPVTAYDAARDQVVLFGGFRYTILDNGNLDIFRLTDTWVWGPRTTNSPISISSISPDTITSGQATTLTVNGTGFQSGFTASVAANGSNFQISGTGLTFVNSNQIRVQVTMGDPPTGNNSYNATLTIMSGGQSASGTFTVNRQLTPTLLIDGSTFSTKQQGQTFVTTGANYTPNRTVTRYLIQPNGQQIILTPIISADGSGNINWSFTASCTTPLGTSTLWATDDATGKSSNTVTQIVMAATSCSIASTIISVSPSPVTGSNNPTTFSVSGSGFQSSGMNVTLRDITHNQTYANRPYTFISSGQINLSPIFGTDGATWSVQVTNTSGQSSNEFSFTVNAPFPIISSLNPSSATASGPGFTLTVNGSSFNNSSVVQWNGSPRPTTPLRNGTIIIGIKASISSSDIASAGTVQVTVSTPAPGGGTSSPVSFVVSAVSVPLSISSVLPNTVTAGQATTLTVNGTGFQSGFTASVTTLSGTFSLNSSALIFINTNQVQVAVNMGDPSAGSESYIATLTITVAGQSASSAFIVNRQAAPLFISSISPNSVNSQLATTLTVIGSGFQSAFSAVVNTPSGSFPLSGGALTFDSNTQVRVTVTMGDPPTGSNSYTATLTIISGAQSASRTFTVNRPPPPVVWLSFVEGNPGVPGDGKFVSATGGLSNDGFSVNPAFPLTGATDGITLTIFLPSGSPALSSPCCLQLNFSTVSPCLALVGGGASGLENGRVIFNNVAGQFFNWPQLFLQTAVNVINTKVPGCGATVNDLRITDIFVSDDSTGQSVTGLDGLAIGFGQNNFAGTRMP